MAQLIEAARREGEVNWAITPPFEDAAEAMRDLVRTKYGVDLKITANSELNFVVKVSKAVSEVQAGIPATFDLLDISDSSISPMVSNNAAQTVEWRRYLPEAAPDARRRECDVGQLQRLPDARVQSAGRAGQRGAAQLRGPAGPRSGAGSSPRSTPCRTGPGWRRMASGARTKLTDYIRRGGADGVRDRYAGMQTRLSSGEYPTPPACSRRASSPPSARASPSTWSSPSRCATGATARSCPRTRGTRTRRSSSPWPR